MISSKIKSLTDRLRSSRDAKTLIENFASLSVLRLVTLILPLITLPYVLRVMGKSGYGVYVMAITMMDYFVTITDFGFAVLAPRDVALTRDDKDARNKVYSQVIFTKIALAVLAILLFSILVIAVPSFRQDWISYLCALPILLGSVFITDWFFQGIEQMKFITIIQITTRVLFTCLVFVVIRESGDFNKYILLQSMTYVLSAVISQLIVRRKHHVRFVRVSMIEFKETVQENLPIFINIFLPNLYNAGGILLLGLFHDHNAVGTYETLHKIAMIGLTLVTILSQVFFPFLSRRKEAFRRSARISIVVGICSAGLALIGTPVVFWYLAIEWSITPFIVYAILCVDIVCLTVIKTYGQNYLITHGYDIKYVRATLISSLIGGGLALILIYPLSAIGAALTLTLSNGLGGAICFKYYRQIAKSQTDNEK